MGNFWDERFAAEEYIYGEQPNIFFAEQLQNLTPGSILLPMEGEGRNAVYAASLGWQVEAFDSSKEGIRKARELTQQAGVSFTYTQHRVEDFPWPTARYDVVALVFAHLPPDIRPAFHKKVSDSLKPGGQLVVEFFHPDQLGRSSGGPKTVDLLYPPKLIRQDFPEIQFRHLEKTVTELSEGTHHKGEAVITRGMGNKVKVSKDKG